MIRKLLKEPLIHFLIGALLVFGFFWATGTGRDPSDYTISIDERDIARLKAGWVQNFRRPPTEEELDGLIDQEIAEEIYYREALRLGLDRGDPIIRRRLSKKMRFLNSEDIADNPSDAALNEWMDGHQGKYTLSSLYDFEQIYLGQNGTLNVDEVKTIAERLNKGTAKPSDFARPISLPTSLNKADISDISRQFGEEFASALSGLASGKWAGPVQSGFGLHLVSITARTPGKPAGLDDIRQRVANDWRAAQVAKHEQAIFKKYRKQYDVQVAGRK